MAVTTTSTSKLRTRGALAALVVIAALILGACMNPQQQEAFDHVNASRGAAGLPALAHDAQAQTKAQAWAERLAAEGKLYHSNLADGMTGWRMLAENVGYGGSIEGVHGQFMGSAGHKANILNRQVTHAGVGVARGGGRTYVVHVFVQR